MKTFEMEVEWRGSSTIDVEAESWEDAVEKATALLEAGDADSSDALLQWEITGGGETEDPVKGEEGGGEDPASPW